MKYEYCLYTWGEFYDEPFSNLHQEKPGYHYFDTKEERDAYKAYLLDIKSAMNHLMLMVEEWEGTDCRIPVMLHRVISIDGYSIETSYDMGPCRDYKQAEFFLENKWYPGCNDYPLGEDFDYSKSKIETVAEWITGPFKESRSNAALIAAAPEMYKILDNFIGCVENDSSEDFLYKYRDIKQLLARARGEN